MTNFTAFKNGPAREILRRIGFDLSSCFSWQDYRTCFVEQNRMIRDKSSEDCLIGRALRLDAVLSTEERVALHAALAAADFAHVADDLWSWQKVDLADRSHRQAVAAAILKYDAT